MDLRFNPFPSEPTAALRRIRHDDTLAKTRLTQYETEYDAFLLGNGHEPTLDLLRLAPEADRAATEQDRKDVRHFKETMEKHATSANTAVGIFNSMTSKSVQTDLSHILDDDSLHPRHKVFQLAAFFTAITPPNVAIGEQVKEEISQIPHATTYVEALRVANQIRDFQAELELVNPTATLSLSEMISKLLSKIRDPKFQMLRFQIAEWEEKRLSSATASLSHNFGSLLSSALTASVASVGNLTSGGGGPRSSSSSSSSAGASVVSAGIPPGVPALPIIVQFRPIIDLIQKFRLSESTIDSNYSINSVDVIINGGNMGVPQSPFPQQQGQFVWVPQDSYSKPAGSYGGPISRDPRMHKYSKANDTSAPNGGGRFSSSRGGKSDRRGAFDGTGARISRGDQSSRGDQPSRGDKDVSRKDRNSRGDMKSSVSEGGDKKRDRSVSSSVSRAHQAASLTVAPADDQDDDEEGEEESSSSEEESK